MKIYKTEKDKKLIEAENNVRESIKKFDVFIPREKRHIKKFDVFKNSKEINACKDYKNENDFDYGWDGTGNMIDPVS